MSKRFLSLALALLFVLAAPSLAAAFSAGDTVRVVNCNEYITLRETPSTKAAELDRLPLHAEAQVIAPAENGFTLVEYQNRAGYVLTKYLEKVETGAMATGDIVRVVNCNEYITLREEASTKAAELDRLPLGDCANFLSHAENGFAYVEYGGQTGYVLEKYLEVLEGYHGTAIIPSDSQRYNVNVFLSNFTEQYFAWSEGCYDSSVPDDSALIVFGINHVWFNQQGHIESGEWGEDNTRLEAKWAVEAAQKYLGRTPTDLYASYFPYKNGYFYWQETGGHVPGGFACLESLEDLGGGLYAVRFRSYDDGNFWENSVCYLTPAQAAAKYNWVSCTGFALIDVGTGSLENRTGWTLERFVIDR